MEPLTMGLGTSAAAKIYSNVFDDLYTFLKGKAKKTLERRKVQERLPTLIANIQNVRKVKTLWQVDFAVDVESFYCDSRVIWPETKTRKEKRKKIDTVSDFNCIKNIVVRGIAGQGKSIFLRHLCIKEFETSQRIPVFIELRRIQHAETVLDHISRFLDILDLPIDRELFKVLSKSGKFVFFLDGFDEIGEAQKLGILNELEYLAASSPKCQFIVTSRPNSPIEMSPLFDVLTLDNLRGEEYKKVIQKLAFSSDYATMLISKIESHKANVAQLLCTPLLVSLLLISYKSFQKLPERLSDFYESIFYVLLQRHNGTKPGFIRPRRCSINDNQYREIFDALCFESKKRHNFSFSYNEVYKIVGQAMGLCKINEDPDNYIKDVKKVTCLILEEGNEYRFIHKSVQEYYAASFIKNRPENIARRFYEACLTYRVAAQWREVLEFLAEIDRYRYSKYYLLPLCRKWLAVENDNNLLGRCPPMTLSRAKNIVGDYVLGFHKQGEERLYSLFFSGLSHLLDERDYVSDIFNLGYRNLVRALRKEEIKANEQLIADHYYKLGLKFPDVLFESKDEIVIMVGQVIEEGYLTNEFESIANKIAHRIYKIWKEAYHFTSREDSFDITSQII